MKFAYFIIGPSVIGFLALILVFALFTGTNIPLISGDRAAFIALVILNYVMCAVGPLPRTKHSEWRSSFNILLYIIGIFVLFFIGVVIAINMGSLPFLLSYRTTVIILTIVLIFKWALFSVRYVALLST